MGRKQANINVILRLEYDEESDGFKDALDSYQRYFKQDGTAADLLMHVAMEWRILHSPNMNLFVDHIGYVAVDDVELTDHEQRFYTEIDLKAEVMLPHPEQSPESDVKYTPTALQALKNLFCKWNGLTAEEKKQAARMNTGAR